MHGASAVQFCANKKLVNSAQNDTGSI